MVTKKKDHFDIDEYIKKLRGNEEKTDFEKLLLQISDEFDRGDFSSLDPEFPSPDFIKAMKKDEQRLKEWEAKKKKKRTSKNKQKEITA